MLQVIVRGVIYPDELGAALCNAGESHEDAAGAPNAA